MAFFTKAMISSEVNPAGLKAACGTEPGVDSSGVWSAAEGTSVVRAVEADSGKTAEAGVFKVDVEEV